MEHGSKVQSHDQAEGVRQLLRPRQRFVEAPQGLVWIAQHPQGLGNKDSTPHSGVVPVAEYVGAVLLRVIERDSLLQMRAGRGKFAKIPQAFPAPCGPPRGAPDPEALRQAKELLSQFVCRL